ncbi:MAG: hypothetical protein GY787_25405 [Alteromonadales bacterium]|nr:hypothetical protein [Alteromonadales bacterium]
MVTTDDLKFTKQMHGGIGSVLKTKSKVTISIQAGAGIYSNPRENGLEPDSYTSFEVALLNTKGAFITDKFINCHGDMVAGYVTRDVIDALIYQLDR